MAAYYNEYEPYAAEWLRNLIAKGYIPDGEVDTRSIVDVRPFDLQGFAQCHFFAGIGGWSLAARLAGWPDERPLWTGSAPCQPFSTAGQQKGQADERHLWPVFFGLIRACRPPVVMGEQVAAAVGKDWLDGVSTDLEGIGYACGAVVVPACAVNAPHRRDRLWFVADAKKLHGNGGEHNHISGSESTSSSPKFGERSSGDVADADKGRWGWRPRDGERVGDGADAGRTQDQCDTAGRGLNSNWSKTVWAIGADGKARRVEPSIRLLAHGVPARVGRLRAYGNAIVPQVAAEVIAAYMESEL